MGLPPVVWPECIARAERDGTRAEIRFRLSSKRTSPFKLVGASVQSTAGCQGVHINLSNAGYTMFGDGLRVLATHSILQFHLHFPSRASPCATRFRTSSNAGYTMFRGSVKSTDYPLHSPFSPSLSLPCVTVCHRISTGLYDCIIKPCLYD